MPALLARSASLGWRRAVLLRRLVAGVFAAAALVLVVLPRGVPDVVPVVVTSVDLAAGTTLDASMLAVRDWPRELVPSGAIAPADAEGRVLVGAARTGEPLTDARLTTSLVPDADEAAVPIRPVDADVAALLVAGSRVDVVVPGERTGEAVVLAADARVITVVPGDAGGGPGRADRGPLVVVALPRAEAARVAAAALSAQVAVTLR